MRRFLVVIVICVLSEALTLFFAMPDPIFHEIMWLFVTAIGTAAYFVGLAQGKNETRAKVQG